jgi:hypothetical protein
MTSVVYLHSEVATERTDTRMDEELPSPKLGRTSSRPHIKKVYIQEVLDMFAAELDELENQ